MAGIAAEGLTGPDIPSVRFRLASPGDDEALRTLLRENPMVGRICVSLEREPSFFAAGAIEGDRHVAVVAEDAAGRIVAMGCRSVRDVYVNGRAARLGYLGQLRVAPTWRRRPRLLREGYAIAGSLPRVDELPYDLSSILAGNARARRLLTAGVAELPGYRAHRRFTTFVLPVRRRGRARRRGPIDIAPTDAADLPDIVACLDRNQRRYQFAPVWTARDLDSTVRTPGLDCSDFLVARRRDQIVGCLARWDQRRFRQAVVRGYGPSLRRWRPLLNAVAPVVGLPRLPRTGEALAQAFLSHVAVDGDDPDVLVALVDAAQHDPRRRDVRSLVIGFAADHPFRDLVRRRYAHQALESTLYLVSRSGGMATADAPDDRPTHVEVALL